MSDHAVTEPGERVIADPLRFKQRLRIGRKAFRTLQARDLLQDLWDTAGVAWTGAAVAKSSLVATTFFAPTGITAWLGLATAATPAGWVVAAAVGSAGLYYCVSRGLAANDRFLDEIPKFISTPLDFLGASLFGLMGMLAVKVAAVDGEIDPRERQAIVDHLVRDWGYDEAFTSRELALLEARQGEFSVEALAQRLAEFQAANPDCNGPAMQAELIAFVQELIRADGIIRPEEADALEKVSGVLRLAGERPASSFAAATRSTLSSVAAAVGTLAGTAISIVARSTADRR